MKKDVTERSNKTDLTVFGCALKSPPVWRQLSWICAAVLVCVAGVKLIPRWEQRGYFTWAADLPLQAMAFVFVLVLISFLSVALFLAQVRTKNSVALHTSRCSQGT